MEVAIVLVRAPNRFGSGPEGLVCLVSTPRKQRNTPVQYSSRKSVTFRTSLTGLSVLVV